MRIDDELSSEGLATSPRFVLPPVVNGRLVPIQLRSEETELPDRPLHVRDVKTSEFTLNAFALVLQRVSWKRAAQQVYEFPLHDVVFPIRAESLVLHVELDVVDERA